MTKAKKTGNLYQWQAEKWLSEKVGASRDRIITEVAELTPEIAWAILERNPDNRTLREKTVETYAHDIQQGRWALNGEAIKLSSEGLLNDGQHRCRAVIRAGQSIETLFVFGCDRDSRMTVDAGTVRTPGDYLGMDGVPNGNNVAAASKYIFLIRNYGKVRSGIDVITSKSQIQQYIHDEIGVAEIVESVRFVGRKGANTLCSQSVLAAAHYLFREVSRRDADSFIVSLIDGDMLEKGSAVYACRNKLLDASKRYTHNERFKILFYCFNKYRAGEKVRQIQQSVSKGEALPALK